MEVSSAELGLVFTSTNDLVSCSQRLPGDHMLGFLVFPFRERFNGASSSESTNKYVDTIFY